MRLSRQQTLRPASQLRHHMLISWLRHRQNRYDLSGSRLHRTMQQPLNVVGSCNSGCGRRELAVRKVRTIAAVWLARCDGIRNAHSYAAAAAAGANEHARNLPAAAEYQLQRTQNDSGTCKTIQIPVRRSGTTLYTRDGRRYDRITSRNPAN